MAVSINEKFNNPVYYLNCSPSDEIENMRLDEIVSKAIQIMGVETNPNGTGDKVYHEYCNKMTKKLGGGEIYMREQSFCDKNQFINNVDSIAGIIVGQKIVDVLSSALAQVGHIKESNGVLWNFDKGTFNVQEFCIMKVFRGARCLTLTPTLIKVSGVKEVNKVLFWGSTNHSGTVSLRQMTFTLTSDDLHKLANSPSTRTWILGCQ
jgi:hypothetical protein